MPEEFWEALGQFNRQEFYSCHDSLEALWMEALHPLRYFYQGILQLAVAYYHLGNDNLPGAMMLLGQGIKRLEYFLPEYVGVDVAHLVEASGEILDQLQRLEPGQPARTVIPTIQYHIHAK